MWDPYYTYFLNIGYSSGMMGKIVQRFPYSLRASLLAKMDVKAARRGFTSWDEDCDAERVVPLVLGAVQELRTIGESLEICILILLRAFPRLL